jgi:hypothetical protein
MAALGPKTQHSFNGLAGCVVQRISRRTGTLVGLYASDDSGMENDPEFPWSTVCEKHGILVSHRTLKLARESLPQPDEWCDECRETLDATKT